MLTALVNMSLFVFYVSLASSESVRVRNVVLDTVSPLCLSIQINYNTFIYIYQYHEVCVHMILPEHIFVHKWDENNDQVRKLLVLGYLVRAHENNIFSYIFQ